MNLAEKLKYLRIEHGYTLDYVANALGITKSSYNRKENGDTRLQAEEVPKLLQLYNIEPNHAAGVKLIFLILTVASARILFYYVTAALKMSKRKPYG